MRRRAGQLWLFLGLFLLGFLAAGPAKGADPAIYLSLVPTVVSGTLSPFVLTLNGKTIGESSFSISEIQLNGILIPPQSGPSQPFFTKTDTDVLDFLLSTPDGVVKQMPAIVLPRVDAVTIAQGSAVLKVSGDVDAVLLDGVDLPLVDGEAKWSLKEDRSWVGPTYTIELKGKGNHPGRLYNLRFAGEPDKIAARPTPEVSQSLPSGGAQVAATERGPAAASEAASGPSPFCLTCVQGGWAAVFQRPQGNSFTAQAAWSPAYRFRESLSVKAELSILPVRKSSGGLFPVLGYEAFAVYSPLDRFDLDLGAGGETWVSYGGTHPVVALEMGWAIPRELFPWVQRAFLGYTGIFFDGVSTKLLELGIGARF